MIMKTAFRRQNRRQYVSCLTGSPTALSIKRPPCAPPRVSPSSSKRYNHQIASWEMPSALCNGSNFNNYNNPSHHVHPRQSCYQKQNYLNRSPQRFFSAVSSSTSTARSSIENTPLDGPGAALLEGLDIHTVTADDGHPLAVYTIEENSDTDDIEQQKQRIPVLLLHGRTWSSVTVYHLVGDSNSNDASSEGEENRSLLQALYNTHNIQPYAMDFRGFGGTPKDESGFVEPLRCVSDVVSVLNWIHEKHGKVGSGDSRPALLGWSHGALIAQITAQRHADALSKLILYGSIYNPNVKYATPPPDDPHKGHTDHDDFPLHEMAARNEYDGAMEDFTSVSNEARLFPPVSAKLFAEAALVSDPIKVQWWNLHQLNECHPALVKVPTMVIAGDQDPYAPIYAQAELFTNLGREVDRVWSIIANADHAVHLSDERKRFVENMNNFLETRL
eukprot:CAMPEP_0201884460 /NCGR_PEP_ID=MMETSP0902-20130614/17256_1 /ASSEMBLY_ACC=CAM_ASM_000551 /TAXON_ID=420261 /ORGANISM="Thalassiosira antarctica, Strain CCMP982" /LENGTH=445 /DNA_ID=CAMNT_0048413435 /DNA_START=103 /DNA_END=1440 /DNA_ORIENTATION=+